MAGKQTLDLKSSISSISWNKDQTIYVTNMSLEYLLNKYQWNN